VHPVRRLGHVPALDGLRAVAILLVVSYHCFGFPPGGTVGVDLFFVLSGFLITTILLEERGGTGTVRLRAFYGRRVRRLFPALAAFIAVFLIATATAGENRLLAALVGASYLANVVDAFGHTSLIVKAHLDPLWSLAQEEQFYLVWPFVLLVFARSRRLVTWIVLTAAALAVYRAVLEVGGQPGPRIYFGPDTHADGLLVGAGLAALRLRSGLKVGEWAGKIGLSAIIPAALFGWTFGGWAIWGQPLFEVTVALLIAAAVSGTELARGLASRPLVWLGKRSYSLYLWHAPIFAAVIFVAGSGILERVAGIAIAVAVAALSYSYVEQPFRRRRRRVEVAAQPIAGAAAMAVEAV
jgi:peptidoglycan/LPS O-acetylase OafA/YrhL